jgi:hypothetical protein
MSDDSGAVRAHILSAQVPIIGAIIKDARPGSYYFAIVPLARDSEGRQVPSARKIEEVRRSLLASGYEVEFIVSDPEANDVEAGLRAALSQALGVNAFAVALALHGRNASVFVELADAVATPAILDAVRTKVERYFASFEIGELTIQIVTREAPPSILACLRVMRQFAPVDVATLILELQARRFNVPSLDWLTHRLDAMRRSGRIVRLGDGKYTLTADALRKLGTTKRRDSPDVIRMLALARRSR